MTTIGQAQIQLRREATTNRNQYGEKFCKLSVSCSIPSYVPNRLTGIRRKNTSTDSNLVGVAEADPSSGAALSERGAATMPQLRFYASSV